MATLWVWVYDTPLGAGAGHRRVMRLVMQQALVLVDAITVAWMPGTHQPRVGHRHAGVVSGQPPVLDRLLELLGAAPEAGTAIHDPPHVDREVLVRGLQRAGVARSFVEDLDRLLVPGTSELWLLADEIDLDLVEPVVEHALARGDVRELHTDAYSDGPDGLAAVVSELWAGPSGSDLHSRRRPIR